MNGAAIRLCRKQAAQIIVMVLSIVLTSVFVQAQAANPAGKLRLDDLDRLAARAADVINVRMDERLLRLATPLLADGDKDDADEVAIQEVVKNLRGVYVKSFGFEKEGEYVAGDLAGIREQLRSGGWEQFVEVYSRREGVNVEVYVLMSGDRVGGLVVLSSEAKELTVINLVGAIDLDKLARLQGQFGVPDLELERPPATQKPTTRKPAAEQKKQP